MIRRNLTPWGIVMNQTPKSLRLQIGIFGRTNVGKSSFLNLISGQQVAITSEVPGTTTDVVEKVMELLPVGPVVFLDTAGIDDESVLGAKRVESSRKILRRADVLVLLVEPNQWGEAEQNIWEQARALKLPVLVVINKVDVTEVQNDFRQLIRLKTAYAMDCSAVDFSKRETYLREFRKLLIHVLPESFLNPPMIIGDLLPAGGLAILIVPIDLQAPKGRLILPQVQTIRDALDNDASVMVVKEREYLSALNNLKSPPDLVVCDSQVVLKMVGDTPAGVRCTTFSTLFARAKGDLLQLVRGAASIDRLKSGDKVLIAEACTHHDLEDDIARVKIPRWLRQYVGADLKIDIYAGRDYPEDIAEYQLVIHCGGCMINRREMLWRIEQSRQANVPVTNYGVCISFLQGVLGRILEPFPAALDVYQEFKDHLPR